jgi:hypothetical protein
MAFFSPFLVPIGLVLNKSPESNRTRKIRSKKRVLDYRFLLVAMLLSTNLDQTIYNVFIY